MSNLIDRTVTALAGFPETEKARKYMFGYMPDFSVVPHFLDSEYWLWRACKKLHERDVAMGIAHLEHYLKCETRMMAYVGCLKFDSSTVRERRGKDCEIVQAVEDVLAL